MIIEGTTSSGLRFAIDKAVLSDVRFLRAARKMIGKDEAEQVAGADTLLLMLFPEGSEAEEALFAHCADEYGHVPLERVYKEIGEMLKIAREKDPDVKK
jgi:hypothetical protein